MNIAIIYNLFDRLRRGREQDKLADSEVLETADAVRQALEHQGHSSLVVNVCHNGLGALRVFDAIFNLAESTLGSDATEDMIAEKLAGYGIAFTGSGGQTLRQCADKALTKNLLINAGIPTPSFQLFRSNCDIRTDLAYPLIVKPVHEDGSIGITEESVVTTRPSLEHKVAEILQVYRQPALVEEFIDGREINAAVMGNGDDVDVLPLSEIVFTLPAARPKIVSFAAKWLAGSDAYENTNNSCPARLDAGIEAAIKRTAAHACQVMGCRDYARVDLRLKGSQIYVLEVNPNPCLNPDGAGFIVSARAAGFSYPEIITRILEMAMARSSAVRRRTAVEA